jgi:voltage-gated potassium channel
MEENSKKPGWKEKWYNIIFKADTPAGKNFDITLLVLIVLSVLIVMLDSVKEINVFMGNWFFILEWVFTIIFTIEYIVRIIVSRKKVRYIRSFYGIIDLLSILPTYLSLVLAGSHFLIIIRILRMLRVFRILKLSRYLKASEILAVSLRQSRYKIIVFLEVVLTTVVIMGSLMYLIEGPESGFTSIPRGIYWAIVTLTTVGFGDITPDTILGQFVASIIMILGYSIIAVPTGIISSEMMKTNTLMQGDKKCDGCHAVMHEIDAKYCKHCGEKLYKNKERKRE